MSLSREDQARRLAQMLRGLGLELSVDERGVVARPRALLNDLTQNSIRELKPELVEFLLTDGEEVINDPEERQHAGQRTPPRSDAENQASTAKALKEAADRNAFHGGGQLVIHNHDGLTGLDGRNSFGYRMTQLARERDRKAAADRGLLPPEGRYVSKWNLFE